MISSPQPNRKQGLPDVIAHSDNPLTPDIALTNQFTGTIPLGSDKTIPQLDPAKITAPPVGAHLFPKGKPSLDDAIVYTGVSPSDATTNPGGYLVATQPYVPPKLVNIDPNVLTSRPGIIEKGPKPGKQ